MESTMIKTQTFELVKGEFSTTEAKEVLLNLINQRINFHKLRNLTSEIRYEKPDQYSAMRIDELQEDRNEILEIIETAKEQGLSFQINANISIELI